MIASHSLDRPRRVRRLACALLATLAISVPAGAQITKKVEPKSSYYRIVVDLTYRNEPLNFDVTVACNGRETTYVDGDRSFLSGLTPAVFGKRMPDGSAVVMVSPELCQGELEKGLIADDFFPLLIHFEKADEPWTGYGYMTEAAYDRVGSPMRIGNAKLRVSDAEDFGKWYSAHARENIVKPWMASHNVGKPFEGLPWKPGDRYFPNSCSFFQKLDIPSQFANAFEELSSKKEKFWSSTAAVRAFGDLFGWRNGKIVAVTQHGRMPELGKHAPGAQYGIARYGHSKIFNETSRLFSIIYPVIGGPDVNKIDNSNIDASTILYADFKYNEKLLGLSYCTNTSGRKGAPSFNIRPKPLSSVNGSYVDDIEENGKRQIFNKTEFTMIQNNTGFFSSFGGL